MEPELSGPAEEAVSSTALILMEYPDGRSTNPDSRKPLSLLDADVDANQAMQHGRRKRRRDSLRDMDTDVSTAVTSSPAPPRAFIRIVVHDDKRTTETTHILTREEIDSLDREVGKGFFLEDDLKAVGHDDLFDALERSSRRRVYWCNPEQRDSLAALRGLVPSSE